MILMKSLFEVQGLLGRGSALVVGLPEQFHLKKELLAADSIKLAMAFAHWSGWRLLRGHLGKTRGSVKLLTGLSFCQTEPRVLYDWHKRSRDGKTEARLFAANGTTFHPKVLLVKKGARAFVVVGSGNLSEGGFVNNIECGLFSRDPEVYALFDNWFDRLFSNDFLSKQLREPDIRHYSKRWKAARKANKEVEQLQQEAEDEIGERHRAGLRNWDEAVRSAKTFFRSQRFKKHYAAGLAGTSKQIKKVLRYPQFDFDRSGLEDFYKIHALGHLIEVHKEGVWRQKARLQAALRHLTDDSRSVEARLEAVLDGRYRVNGVGLNFLTKVLAAHAPSKFSVWNDVVRRALDDFGYEETRGLRKSQKYLEFAELMRRFLTASGARSTLDLDAFFYEYYAENLKEDR
jgi:HKD family nuclease